MDASGILLGCFFLFSGLHIVNEVFPRKNHDILKDITKTLIIPSILLFYAVSTTEINGLIVVGLIFGWCGDILLLRPKVEMRFLGGMVSFMLGHILYIFAFFKQIRGEGIVIPYFLMYLAFLVLYSLVLIFKLMPSLGDMKIPVIVYCGVIVVMSLGGYLILASSSGLFLGNPVLVFIGSLIFIISDSLYAWVSFKNNFKHGYALVILTYSLAQIFIASGFIYWV